MKKMIWVFAGIAMVILSCKSNQKLLKKDEMIRYINNSKNGLVQQHEINGINVRLCYQPFSLMVSREIEAARNKEEAFIKEVEKRYKDNYYFMLQVSKDNKEVIRQLGSFERYSDMLQVFSFKMNQYINLTTAKKDTVELADYLFEQSYGLSNSSNILLSFEKNKIKNLEKDLEINLGECGLGVGNLKFRFEKEDLDKVPKLDYHSSL